MSTREKTVNYRVLAFTDAFWPLCATAAPVARRNLVVSALA